MEEEWLREGLFLQAGETMLLQRMIDLQAQTIVKQNTALYEASRLSPEYALAAWGSLTALKSLHRRVSRNQEE